MTTALRLLLAEDSASDAELLLAEVRRAGYLPQASVVYTPGTFLKALEDRPEIVICDYTMPAMTAPDALAILKEKSPDLPLIVVSGTMDEATCVNCLRLGAADYLLKDRLSRLGPAIKHALARRQLDAYARRAESERRQTMIILRGLVENSVAAISVRNLDGETLVANDRYKQLYVSPSPVPTHPPDQAAPDQAAPDQAAPGQAAPDQAAPGQAAVEQVDPGRVIEAEESFEVDGLPRTFYSVRYPVQNAEREVFAVGSILVDITVQKQIENDLRAARRELQQRAEHLDQVNAELREVDRLKTEFVASVSHELRTPLTSIRGYAELLLEDAEEGNSQQAKMLDIIDRNARRLLSLIEDLLMLSKLDAKTLEDKVEPIDLVDLVDGALVVLQPGAETATVRIETELKGPLPVEGDRSQLERVLFNLLSNAVKFSHPAGVVTVGGTVDADAGGTGQVVLTVTDHGLGISAEELPRLFTRFFRAANDEAHNIPGTGLGLAVVREIVEKHHGEVSMASTLGEGSTVTVRLPLRP